MSQVLVFAHAVNDILTQYIEIQNDIFKLSLRRVIPIPGIFKSIDYKNNERKIIQLTSDLLNIQNNLNDFLEEYNLSKNEEDFLITINDYIDAMLYSMEYLKEICNKLDLKTKKQIFYNIDEYKKDIEKFNKSVQTYQFIGYKLNKLCVYI